MILKTEVPLPDELWANLLNELPGADRGIETSVRLFSGEVVERLVISNRGNIVGREAAGLARYHGTIDATMLNFSTDDIEAVQVPAFHFWQRPRWISLNPLNPTRLKQQKNTKLLHLPPGSPVVIGQSAKPIKREFSDTIARLVRGIEGVREAYLPQCYMKGIVDPPAQVLIVVFDVLSGEAYERAVTSILGGLSQSLPAGFHIDVWPMKQGDRLLATIRGTGTQIVSEAQNRS